MELLSLSIYSEKCRPVDLFSLATMNSVMYIIELLLLFVSVSGK